MALCRNGFYGAGGRGGGCWQLFPTEFGRLCVPLKKSWLRPCKRLKCLCRGIAIAPKFPYFVYFYLRFIRESNHCLHQNKNRSLAGLRTFELARIGVPYQPHKNDQRLFSLNLISTFYTACGVTSIILPKIVYLAFTNDRTR